MALVITLFLCLISSSVSFGNEVVPALFWSPERAMSNLPDVSSNDVLQPDVFNGNFLKPLMGKAEHSAVVFLQDKLHMDDFTKYADVYSVESTGGAFKNIKNLMEENFSLELPQVSQASKAVKELQSDYSGAVHSITSAEDLAGLDLSAGPFLLLVHLPATEGNIDQEAAIAKNDEMIGDVCKHLSKRSIKYAALYTGLAASQEVSEESQVHSGRHLLADAEADVGNMNGTLMNVTTDEGHMYMFMRTINVCIKNETTTGKNGNPKCHLDFEIVPKDSSADKSVATNSTAQVELTFSSVKGNNDSSDPYDISITMTVADQKDRWYVQEIILKLEPTTATPTGQNETKIANGSLVNRALDLKVPILYSFHCTQLELYLDSIHDPEYAQYAGSFVQINGFQFQPFKVQQHRFFNSVDCVGFFTAGIWMGLFPVVLLLLILLSGTMMLLNLSIMDRYDDPKGKTITVNTPGAD